MNIKSFKDIKKKFLKLESTFLFKSSKNGETEIEYTKNEVGTEVYVSTANGSELAPDGKIELPNGDSFIVTDGKISEVLTVANEETEEKLKAEESEEEKAEEEEIDLIIEGVEDEEKEKEDLSNEEEPTEDNKEVEALKAEIEDLKNQIKELKGEFAKQIDTKIEEFKAVLKNTPASFSKQNTIAEDVKEDKWASLAKRFS